MLTQTFDDTIYILDACCLQRYWREKHPDKVAWILYDRTDMGWEYITTETFTKRKEQSWDDLLTRYRAHTRDQKGKLKDLPDVIVRRRIGTNMDQVRDFIAYDPTCDTEGKKIELEIQRPVFYPVKK